MWIFALIIVAIAIWVICIENSDNGIGTLMAIAFYICGFLVYFVGSSLYAIFS